MGLHGGRAFVWVMTTLCSWGVGSGASETDAGLYSVNASNIIVFRRGYWFSASAVADILHEVAGELSISGSTALEIHPNHTTHLTGAWAEINITEGLPAGLDAISMRQRARKGWAVAFPGFAWGTPGLTQELQIYWLCAPPKPCTLPPTSHTSLNRGF